MSSWPGGGQGADSDIFYDQQTREVGLMANWQFISMSEEGWGGRNHYSITQGAYNTAPLIGRKSQGIQLLKRIYAWVGLAPPSP